MIRKIRREQDILPSLSLAGFKALLREQFFMLLIDPAGAMKALPSLLPDDPDLRERAFRLLEQVVHARGPLPEEAEDRLFRIAEMFGVKASAARTDHRGRADEQGGRPQGVIRSSDHGRQGSPPAPARTADRVSCGVDGRTGRRQWARAENAPA